MSHCVAGDLPEDRTGKEESEGAHSPGVGMAEKVWAGRWSDWELAGVKPTNARSDDNADEGDLVRKRQRKVSSDGAHFYNQMQKIGACNVWTNYKAFEDFNVNPRWISVWMQRQKILFVLPRSFTSRPPQTFTIILTIWKGIDEDSP